MPENEPLEKGATIKRFEHSPLGIELRKENDIAKDQYKFFKDKMNAINNNRAGGTKTEDDEIISNADHSYIVFILCTNYV